jgi:hypothetical protein
MARIVEGMTMVFQDAPELPRSTCRPAPRQD